jgi:hypothetical protein
LILLILCQSASTLTYAQFRPELPSISYILLP